MVLLSNSTAIWHQPPDTRRAMPLHHRCPTDYTSYHIPPFGQVTITVPNSLEVSLELLLGDCTGCSKADNQRRRHGSGPDAALLATTVDLCLESHARSPPDVDGACTEGYCRYESLCAVN